RPDELTLSYNGGKDCLVLLILILASLPAHFPASTSAPPLSSCTTTPFPVLLQAIYIRPPAPFLEVDSFVASSTSTYHLDLVTSDQPMKQALAEYLQELYEVKAMFVGTRRTDPHGGELEFFQMTDGNWPRFMRVHPVIDWHYREVWAFIRALDIPYCPLYDKGYTSLGGTDDTHPNPALRAESGREEGFRPAYELTEDREERLGRDGNR
ncbi:putative FAD synthetase, partial [Xylariales sp. AK1849]